MLLLLLRSPTSSAAHSKMTQVMHEQRRSLEANEYWPIYTGFRDAVEEYVGRYSPPGPVDEIVIDRFIAHRDFFLLSVLKKLLRHDVATRRRARSFLGNQRRDHQVAKLAT